MKLSWFLLRRVLCEVTRSSGRCLSSDKRLGREFAKTRNYQRSKPLNKHSMLQSSIKENCLFGAWRHPFSTMKLSTLNIENCKTFISFSTFVYCIECYEKYFKYYLHNVLCAFSTIFFQREKVIIHKPLINWNVSGNFPYLVVEDKGERFT